MKPRALTVDAARVVPILAGCGQRWGPGGSVGFELATGVAHPAHWYDALEVMRELNATLFL
jgi:hypothetical protein